MEKRRFEACARQLGAKKPEAGRARSGAKPLGRLVDRLRAQVEGAEVHGHKSLGAYVERCLHCLLGVQVHEAHHLGRLVGANRYRRQIERTQALSDPLKALEVAGIAGEVEAMFRPDDGPGLSLIHI